MPVKLRDEDHAIKLRNRIKEFYRKKTFADILLRSSDGLTYRTHRLVLATYSDFFKPFASRRNQNGNQALEVVNLDIKGNILSSLVDYIYKGYIEIEPKLQTEVQKAAELLELQDVVDLLEESTDPHPGNQKPLQGVKKQPSNRKSSNIQTSAGHPSDGAPANRRPKSKSTVPEEDEDLSQSVTKESGKVNARRQTKKKSNIAEQRNKEANKSFSEGLRKGTSKRQPKRKAPVNKKQAGGKCTKRAKKSSEDDSFEKSQGGPESEFEIEMDVCEDEIEDEMEPGPQLKQEAANESWTEHWNQLSFVGITPRYGTVSLVDDSNPGSSRQPEETESKASLLKQLEYAYVESPSTYDEEFAAEEIKFKPQDNESPAKVTSGGSHSNDLVYRKNNRVASKQSTAVAPEDIFDDADDVELQEIDDDDDDYDPEEDFYGPFILKTHRNNSKKPDKKKTFTSKPRRKVVKVANFKKLHISKKRSMMNNSKLIAANIVKNKLCLILCGNNAILRTEVQSDASEGEPPSKGKPQYKCTLCNKFYKHKSVCKGHIHKMHVKKKIGLQHKLLKREKLEKYLRPSRKCKLSEKYPMKISLKSKGPQKMKLSAASLEVYFPSKFKCLICERLLKDRQSLHLHLQGVHKMSPSEARQHESNLNACEVPGCDFSTFKIRELVNHVKSSHPEIEHRCPVCNFTFYLTTALNRHMLLYHINRDKLPHQCSVCDKKLTGLREKKLHEANKHGIVNDLQKHECPVEGCGFSTYMKDSLKTHANVHKDTRLPCPHCDKKLKGKKNLENHINRIHLNIRPYLCQVCGNSYCDPFYLKAHIESKHIEEKKYKCEHCPYQSSVKMQFTAHCLGVHGVKVEKDKKDFPCPQCPYRGVIKSHLRMHMVIHTKKPVFACEICGDTFYYRNGLRSHKQWRHSETLYRCSYCTYTSKSASKIKYHTEQQHTMSHIRPYECEYCDFNCATSGNMRKHVMGKHKGREVKYRKNEELIAQLREMRKQQAPIIPEAINKEV